MANSFLKSISEAVKYWYIPLIIGIILVLTGVWTFMSPLESYLALSMIFSISFLVAGIMETYFAIANKDQLESWGWTLTLGLLTTLVGIMLLTHPEISIVTLPLYVGFTVMFRSITAVGTAIDMKNYGVSNWKTLMVLGVLGVIFAFILAWNPLFAGMTLVFWTGIAFLASGIFNIDVALKLKNLHKS